MGLRSTLRQTVRDALPLLRYFLVAAPIFGVLVGYMHLNIETAMLRRRAAIAAHERDELARRNRALREGLANLGSAEDDRSVASGARLPLLEENEIVRIRLPELPSAEGH